MQKGSIANPSLFVEPGGSRFLRIIYLLMKCSFILLFTKLTMVGMLYANTVTGQDLSRKVDLKLEGMGIKESLLAIEAKSGVKFLLPQKVLDISSKKVNLKAPDITVAEAIKNVLSNSGLRYKVVDHYVVIEAIPARRSITGKVIDAVNKETLPGVSIRIKGVQGGTTTDGNGNFTLTIAQPEAILVFSYMGYKTREVKVDKNTNNLNVALSSASNALNEVTVQARRKTNTEAAVLDERKKASIVQDAISAVQIERTASITTTQALQRVPGVTVTDDKFVAIRGLGDRSVVGQLNGVRLASSDPDRSSIPFDLVPASLLDNVTIYKTVTPDKPADAAAGIVELKTKSVPDSMVFNVIVQSGFNSNIGIGGQHNSFFNSEMGFLGDKINNKNLSADFLNLATQYKGGLTQIQNLISNSGYSPATKQEVTRINNIMQGFDPVLTTKYKQSPLNQLYSATFGNSYTLFKKHKIGVIAGGNYYRRTTDISGGDIQQYSIYQGVVTGNPQVSSPRNIPNYITPNNLYMGRYQTYKENTGNETLNYGTLLGLTYRFDARNEISMQYLGSWGGETQATNMYGAYQYTGLPGEVKSTIYSLKQSYRNLNTFNLQGEHKFLESDYSPKLSYNISSSKAGQNDPDYRFVTLADYTPRDGSSYSPAGSNGTEHVYSKHLYALSSGYVNGFGAYGIIQAEPNGRRYRNLSETNYNYKADLSVPFKLFGQKQEFKTGVNYLNRDRVFTENVLFLPGSNFSSNKATPLYTVSGNLDRLVGPEIIGIHAPIAGLGEGASPVGGFLYNSQKSPNNYAGFFETIAGYAMLDLKVTKDLRLTGGVRFESTNIQSAVDTSGVFLDPALTAPGTNIPLTLMSPNSVYKPGYKPYYSLNTTYNFKENMNFRAGFNTTLARPELREITNVFEFDAFQMGLVVGNPNLINQYTQNLDFRWEWFPNNGEVIAVSLFGKRIKNQLYKVFSLKTSGLAATYPEYPTIRFENDPNIGKVWGVEFEIVKDLGKVWFPLRNFFAGTNLLLAQSDIKKSPERLEANRSLDRHTPDNSPLFEQAPFSINGWLNYDNKRSGTSLTGTFNMVGERLIQINLTGEPDLYTRPVPMLDFVFSQRLTRRIIFKGYAKNILNPAVQTVYANPGTGGKWYGNQYINRSYKRGGEFMMGFTYNLY
ncbi:carboxypeptidase-like regulatory domain-containing protein [Pedobacter nyackensis]|uniref:TonB-dependent receptor n=1 Tax=Pedobacter nyackensis TaxID=475255 RepID=A0A1W2CYG9_9SPHI|nr:carboxypeptidase-like regulatory domain-containing protein [Pedobacter nyackensis]SMC89986.1 TonB-dependent receptor [Pedobacter nyackensis]